MRYEHIKNYKLNQIMISEALGYKNVQSFRSSSAHRRIMNGINILLGEIKKS